MFSKVHDIHRLFCFKQCPLYLNGCAGSPRCMSQCPPEKLSKTAHKQLLDRIPTNPQLGDDLPEHVYEGKRHRLGLRLYLCGVATSGALGRASFIRPDYKRKQTVIENKIHPMRSDFAEHYKVVDVSCGYGFTAFAVNSRNAVSLYGTGLNDDGQIGLQKSVNNVDADVQPEPVPIELSLSKEDRIVKVSCGRAHTLALSKEGDVYTVGSNCYGQCGRPVIPHEDYAQSRVYTRLAAIRGPVTQIEAGQDTSFFLRGDGALYSCGWGADGQTGRGHYASEPEVGRCGGALHGVTVVKVSCTTDCVLALSDDGDVFGWGNNEYLQLHACTTEAQLHTPQHLPLPATVGRVVDVAAGGSACYLLNDRGEVYSWGFGVLGRGPKNVFSKQPEIIPSTLLGNNVLNPGSKVVSISTGTHMVACITDMGDLFTWGKNVGGCLGIGHSSNQSFPMKVCIIGRALKASCGINHMAIIVRQL